MESFKDFTGLYPLSKTLRFELRPIGRTHEHICTSGILDEDEHRAESYLKVKKIIDEYHKSYIEEVLADFCLATENNGKKDSLEEYLEQYRLASGSRDKKLFDAIHDNLRTQIAKRLSSADKYKTLFSEKLIKEDLIAFLQGREGAAEKIALVEEFRDFTTYFVGFHENRRNMYTDEAIATAIPYRLIHENLPKFVDNMRSFEQAVQTDIKDHLTELYGNFEEYLNVNAIEEMFQIDYYNMVLTQSQIDVYNSILGGKVLDDGTKIQGLNEYINLYNQQHKEARLPKLKPLFKQILSDRSAISWLPEEFTTDNEVLSAIQECYLSLSEQVIGDAMLKQLLESLADYDLTGIYLRNDLPLTDISQQMFGSWSTITTAIKTSLAENLPRKKKETDDKYHERIDKAFKALDSFALADIDRALKASGYDYMVEDYYAKVGATDSGTDLFTTIADAYNKVATLLSEPYPKEKNLAQDKEHVEQIKNLLDALKELQHFIKPLLGSGKEAEKDERFYADFDLLWECLDQITPLYNMVRNYATRKPYATSKIKINFQNSTLMAGWDLNKERDNTTVILRKEGLYYLAIMNKKYNKIFNQYPSGNGGECYEKMVYKLLPGANKMLPKVFFSKGRIGEFAPSEDLKAHYDAGTHKKGDNFSLQHCHELIDFFKDSINKHEDWNKFGFQFSNTDTYEDLSGFYREVEAQGYKLTFSPVSADYINEQVEKGHLYLFQIYNKDFSPYSKGTPNMHTLYWKMLFDERNLADVVYKLNGEAEVFFRKASIHHNRPTHPANEPIANKNVNNEKKQSLFTYDLVKDRRYTVDKYQFHVPITLNFKSAGYLNLNQRVNEYLCSQPDAHVIGIDRGERHLLYLVVIDRHGNVKEQFTLNEIVNEYGGNRFVTDYHQLLQTRETQRKEARQSWQSIENIKDLKEGYLSQVVHKIAELMVQYNAIVVLEDLNFGFMRGRQKVEKQVYQKFEKMLIDKLNYLVDKRKEPEALGGLLHAYQLTSKFESFQKLGKQSGFLFYIPAWNTSKIDPVTGFANLLDTRYESIEAAKRFFGHFDAIRYNESKKWYEFDLDYNKFNDRAEGTRTEWTLCTHGKRIETFRNPDKNSQWDSVEVDLTQRFDDLFAEYHIKPSADMQAAIAQQSSADFFKSLTYLLKLTLQMRNSITGTETDYLVSPVADAQGHFFDSRTCGDTLPKNADANGAYNIARKGLWALRQIRHAEDLTKLKLAITNKEWLQFAQQKPYLND